MKSPLINFIFHFVIYYAVWLAGIVMAADNKAIYATLVVCAGIVLQLIWQYYRKDVAGLFQFVLWITGVGFIVDTIFLHAYLIYFNANPFKYVSPPWMIAIWVCFAIFVFATFKKFYQHSLVIGVLSLIFFPVAYIVGVKLGAAEFPHGIYSSISIGIAWAIIFPDLLSAQAKNLEKFQDA